MEAARGVAQLAYVDEQGPHIFVMRKDVVSIGRGGSAHWVDVQVTTGPRVSREHCRIRRADDGRFFAGLEHVGTSVNGQRVNHTCTRHLRASSKKPVRSMSCRATRASSSPTRC